MEILNFLLRLHFLGLMNVQKHTLKTERVVNLKLNASSSTENTRASLVSLYTFIRKGTFSQSWFHLVPPGLTSWKAVWTVNIPKLQNQPNKQTRWHSESQDSHQTVHFTPLHKSLLGSGSGWGTRPSCPHPQVVSYQRFYQGSSGFNPTHEVHPITSSRDEPSPREKVGTQQPQMPNGLLSERLRMPTSDAEDFMELYWDFLRDILVYKL